MSGFRRTRAGVEVTLAAAECAVLRQVFDSLVDLLADPEPAAGTGSAPDPLERLVGPPPRDREHPQDPALARLLPDAYADPELAGEYRRLTEGELRADKVRRLRAAQATLPAEGGLRASLDEPTAEAWLAALNDARLTLGVRYDVDEDVADTLAGLPPSDPRLPGLSLYLWLGWLQETLVEAVDTGP